MPVQVGLARAISEVVQLGFDHDHGRGCALRGWPSDRYFRAYDAKSGKLLSQYKTNSGVISPPTTFSIDGVRYVAVVSGCGWMRFSCKV